MNIFLFLTKGDIIIITMNIEEYSVKNQKFIKILNNNNFEIVFSSCGASIYSIKIDDDFLTQTLMSTELHKTNYLGKTIGRVANRIPGNSIEIGNTKYLLANNEGPNTLHGGLHGISNKNFSYVIKENIDNVELVFHYVSPHLESGFPGNMTLKITYFISKSENTFQIIFESDTDETTPCSLTNHAFFCLGEKSLSDLTLKINASSCIYPNPKDLLFDHIGPVNKVLDFRKSKVVTKDINDKTLQKSRTKGYDHYYFFDQIDEKNNQIELSSKRYLLKIRTDYEGVQIYTDNYRKTDKCYNLPPNKINRAIAIEPSSPHNKLHMLKKDEHYRHFINYEFEKLI